VSQSSEFCRHNPLCFFSSSVNCCRFRYRLSPKTFGYSLICFQVISLTDVFQSELYIHFLCFTSVLYLDALVLIGFIANVISSLFKITGKMEMAQLGDGLGVGETVLSQILYHLNNLCFYSVAFYVYFACKHSGISNVYQSLFWVS
jgi:hypothetical protein